MRVDSWDEKDVEGRRIHVFRTVDAAYFPVLSCTGQLGRYSVY